MLEMRDKCETCGNDLAHDGEAYICSFECTYCGPCNNETHKGTCPNCGGDLQRRPTRKAS